MFRVPPLFYSLCYILTPQVILEISPIPRNISKFLHAHTIRVVLTRHVNPTPANDTNLLSVFIIEILHLFKIIGFQSYCRIRFTRTISRYALHDTDGLIHAVRVVELFQEHKPVKIYGCLLLSDQLNILAALENKLLTIIVDSQYTTKRLVRAVLVEQVHDLQGVEICDLRTILWVTVIRVAVHAPAH